jgi:hypothetical protein
MRTTTKTISLFICIALLFTTLVACTNDTQSYEPTTSQQSSSNSDATTTSATEDEDGRPLIYNNNGIKIYASKVRFPNSATEKYAEIKIYYTAINDNDATCRVDAKNLVINGNSSNSNTGVDAMFALNKHMVSTDSDASTIVAYASDFNLKVNSVGDEKYVVDSSIAYTVTGFFEISVGDFKDSGTISFTIPANFPENKFRTDEKWVSTK